MFRVTVLLTLLLALVVALGLGGNNTSVSAEDSGYSKEFEEKVKKRLGYYERALERYKNDRKPSGDALAQAIRDYLIPCDHPNIVDTLISAMNSIPDGLVMAACVKAIATVTEGPVLDYVIGKGIRKGKPETRAMIIEAMGKGEVVQTFTLLCEILRDDKDNEIVRAAAARALGYLQDARGVNVLVSVEKDKSEVVKLALIEALLMFQDDVSAGCISAMIADETSWKVRAAAIKASVKRKLSGSVGYMITRLRKENGRLFGDLLNALKEITGIDKGENINAWEQWFEHSDYAKGGKVEKVPREDIPGNYTTITYHGIRTHSKNVVFIVDRSESMKERCDPKALKGDYMKPDEKFVGETRMELVKWELSRTIARLDKNTSFNIITYSTDVRSWKKKSLFATDSNKKAAVSFVNSLTPEGRTNTWGALLEAFGCKSFGDGKFNANPMGDTIFLLTDGDPNEGELDDPDEILAGVAELNRFHHIVIHCIAVGRFNKAFCQDLAEKNGGEFIDLGD
ncbi:MAG: hypothetical protein Kow00107_00010 [Planctomycetota bacterium]